MSQITEQIKQVTPHQIKQHLSVDRYGDFVLTSAVRPWVERQVVPKEGYRLDEFKDDESGYDIPSLAAAVTSDKLFDTFLELLDQMNDVVDVIIESHHNRKNLKEPVRERMREHIDLPILKSYCFDFQELLMEDGCFSLAVIDPTGPAEIQFDDHKLLVVYAKDLAPYREILEECGIAEDTEMKFINEGEHLHSSMPEFQDLYEQFAYQLGVE